MNFEVYLHNVDVMEQRKHYPGCLSGLDVFGL